MNREQAVRAVVLGVGIITSGCGYISAPKTAQEIESTALRSKIERTLGNQGQQQESRDEEKDPKEVIQEAISGLDEIIHKANNCLDDDEKRLLMNALLDGDVSAESVHVVTGEFSADAQKCLEKGASILAEHPALGPHVLNTIRRLLQSRLQEEGEVVKENETWAEKVARLTKKATKKVTSIGVEHLNDPRVNDTKLVGDLATKYGEVRKKYKSEEE